MSSLSIPPVTSLSGPHQLFPGAHDFQMLGCTFQVASGDIHNHPPIVYYWKMRLSSAPPDYYIVGCIEPGSSGETSHIVRRFMREEDRDRFESLLNKFGWSPFTSKPLWKLTVNGDPCLAVSSAAVYTLQEVMPYQSYEQRLRMFLKLSSFFMESHNIYPGKWNWGALWYHHGPYTSLKLFNENGNLIIDLELLESYGLLYQEGSQFLIHGDKHLYSKVGSLNKKIENRIGRVGLAKLREGHLQESKDFLEYFDDLDWDCAQSVFYFFGDDDWWQWFFDGDWKFWDDFLPPKRSQHSVKIEHLPDDKANNHGFGDGDVSGN